MIIKMGSEYQGTNHVLLDSIPTTIPTTITPDSSPAGGLRKVQWVVMDDQDGDDFSDSMSSSSSSSISSSSFGDSSTTNSMTSSTSSSDLVEDASSNGPLYELSDLMACLPIKRGLSKHFDGKSQSFTSLSSVRSIEDLAKKESRYKKSNKMKNCSKSYGGGLDIHKGFSKTISKKSSSTSSSRSSSFKRNSFLGSSPARPPIPENKRVSFDV